MFNNYLFPLVVSYPIALFIKNMWFDVSVHYLLFSLHYLLIAFLCSKSKNKLILCYGLLNVAALMLHIPLMFDDVEFCFCLFHDAVYGVGNWIIAVELLMVGFGGYNAIIYFVDNWRDNGSSGIGRFMRNTKEALL